MTIQTVWVTRERTTVGHIRGLLVGLEQAGALDLAEVRVMTLGDTTGVTLPNGMVFTQDNLPVQGFLFVAEAKP